MLVGDEGEGTPSQHFLAEVAENRACLGVQVSDHFVRSPATEEADDICVNATTKQGVCACSSEAAG